MVHMYILITDIIHDESVLVWVNPGNAHVGRSAEKTFQKRLSAERNKISPELFFYAYILNSCFHQQQQQKNNYLLASRYYPTWFLAY